MQTVSWQLLGRRRSAWWRQQSTAVAARGLDLTVFVRIRYTQYLSVRRSNWTTASAWLIWNICRGTGPRQSKTDHLLMFRWRTGARVYKCVSVRLLQADLIKTRRWEWPTWSPDQLHTGAFSGSCSSSLILFNDFTLHLNSARRYYGLNSSVGDIMSLRLTCLHSMHRISGAIKAEPRLHAGGCEWWWQALSCIQGSEFWRISSRWKFELTTSFNRNQSRVYAIHIRTHISAQKCIRILKWPHECQSSKSRAFETRSRTCSK